MVDTLHKQHLECQLVLGIVVLLDDDELTSDLDTDVRGCCDLDAAIIVVRLT